MATRLASSGRATARTNDGDTTDPYERMLPTPPGKEYFSGAWKIGASQNATARGLDDQPIAPLDDVSEARRVEQLEESIGRQGLSVPGSVRGFGRPRRVDSRVLGLRDAALLCGEPPRFAASWLRAARGLDTTTP